MANASRDLSTRMVSKDQNTNERIVRELLFSHFRRHKVEISNAIKKTFPFLETLHDREFISDKLYTDCQESCRNLVPVQNVVYNVLSEVEKTFDLKFLDALFSEVHMEEYPELRSVHSDFQNVIQAIARHPQGDGAEAVERPDSQLSLEQGTGESACQSLTWRPADSSAHTGTSPPDSGASESCLDTGEASAGHGDGAPAGQQDHEQGAQGPEVPNHGLQTNSCSVYLVDERREKQFFDSEAEQQAESGAGCNQAANIIGKAGGECVV
ncbi:PREDICTED: nuclear autoantigen Sp-100-like [Condylura cristata]|uniref:nuclear autoantigen Sp-100-like n=1 Tax=Condylura cristata TaxID=143302 RepID=UPI0003347E69|nr:PREDICTED: nuclear autoantigen Sp-100-like [Condylura cristata]